MSKVLLVRILTHFLMKGMPGSLVTVLLLPAELRAPSSDSAQTPDPRPPGKAPHSLFLQEVHLQALHVQEPAQLQEPPASKGETAVSRSGTQGPQQMSAMPPSPSCSVRAQPWELLPHSGTCRSPSFSLRVLDGRSPPDFLHRQVPGSRPDWG